MRLGNVLLWAKRNERRLGAVLFAFGFFTDFLTFGLLPVEIVNIIFLCYLTLAFVCTLGAHAFAETTTGATWWKQTLSVIFPLGVQYAFGGLLSGFVVFYTAHSVILASWPFLIFLALMYIGNEYFRMYKHYLIFQTTLFFFTLYAYAIFGLPLLVKTLGPLVFFGSTIVALLIFVLFLYLLRLINRTRFDEEFRSILVTVLITVALVSSSYVAGVIPPIPLVMKDSGVYHSLSKSADTYVVTAEVPKPWWDITPPVIHHTDGELIYAYSAVAAPVSFGSVVVHRFEHKGKNGWNTESKISFPITGGRQEGYRGYSAKGNLTEGQWRVSVETPGGQVIGRIRFDVEKTSVPPLLREETL